MQVEPITLYRLDSLLAVICGFVTLIAARRAFRPIGYVLGTLLNRSRGAMDDTPTLYDVVFGGFSIGYLFLYFALLLAGWLRALPAPAHPGLPWLVAAVLTVLAFITGSMYLKIRWIEQWLLAGMVLMGACAAIIWAS